MEVVLSFTDNEVQLFGALLEYKPVIVEVTEIEEEDGSITVEETQKPNPIALEQFVDGAIQAYVGKYKKDAIAEYVKVIAKETTEALTQDSTLEQIVAAVEAHGIGAIKDILKSQL